MTRWALLVGDTVDSVVEQDDTPTVEGLWQACGPEVGPGWLYIHGMFLLPAPVYAWDAFEFYRRLTSSERIAIRVLAQTDPVAEDFVHTLDAAIASGSPVLSTDPDLAAALAYLQAHPVGAPIWTAERVAQLVS